jgi:hypothetical protein
MHIDCLICATVLRIDLPDSADQYCLLGQKFTLNTTRRALIREVLNERLESLSLIDPLTQLLSRRAMNEFIPEKWREPIGWVLV